MECLLVLWWLIVPSKEISNIVKGLTPEQLSVMGNLTYDELKHVRRLAFSEFGRTVMKLNYNELYMIAKERDSYKSSFAVKKFYHEVLGEDARNFSDADFDVIKNLTDDKFDDLIGLLQD